MAKKETNKKETKNKKSFFKDFKAELKKVSWPTPKQLVNNTIAVVSIVLITAIIVFVLDIAFEAINKQGINKVKEVITSSNSIEENTTSEETTEGETKESEETNTEEIESNTDESETNSEEANTENSNE